jgi:hypothetical protein
MVLPVVFPFFGAKYRQDGAFPAGLSVVSHLLLSEIPARWSVSDCFAGIFRLERLPGPPVLARITDKM